MGGVSFTCPPASADHVHGPFSEQRSSVPFSAALVESPELHAMSASRILGLASLLSSIARNQHDREASVHNSGLTLMRRSDRRVLSNSCQRDAAPWPGQSATGILRAMRQRTAWGLMRIYRFRSQTFVHGGQWAMQCVIQVFVSSTRRGLGPDPGSGHQFHQIVEVVLEIFSG